MNETKPMSRQEALAEAWASIDGKLSRFRANRANRSLDRTDGTYSGYMEEAGEMIARLESRGYTVVPIDIEPDLTMTNGDGTLPPN